VLDITNPEVPPTVLGEFTMTRNADTLNESDMGYTTSIPTMVVMKVGNSYDWYLILGSGPTNLEGESVQNAKVAVIPMRWMTSTNKRALRIPKVSPADAVFNDLDPNMKGGIFDLTASPKGFVSDLITVDYDLDKDYKSDAVYFGTVEGSFASGWDGQMYRMVTRELDSGVQQTTYPEDWVSLWPKSAGKYAPLIDAGKPVVAAASVGTDGYNFWVYFGTGRFYDVADKADASAQLYFGIKEPMDCATGEFTWGTVSKSVAGALGVNPSAASGSRGLLRVDQIQVKDLWASAGRNVEGTLNCVGSTDLITDLSCLPLTGDPAEYITTYGGIIDYIAGKGCISDNPTGVDGWYKNFQRTRERNLGQATLLGGLLTYTSYQPFEDPCVADGDGYLYGLYYRTGIPWFKPIFSKNGVNEGIMQDSIYLGLGLALTPSLHVGGENKKPKAFVQTSTGAIIEVPELETPEEFRAGRASWIELTE
jgi:type IV pilus assembly protein PilY1